jgi:hypothetical protein
LKHGSVFDPEKGKVQNMGCKKQGAKIGSGLIQKEKRSLFSFELQAEKIWS